MKILLITAEEWNDNIYGNGVLTNWFTEFEAEFAQIYISPGIPSNSICNRYFRITDGEMAHSILSKARAGSIINIKEYPNAQKAAITNPQRKGIYALMKKISLWWHTPVMMIRDFIWLTGRYDKIALNQFISDFNPDIVFCPRYLTPSLMRLERIVSNMTNAPFIAFTADDEASYREYNLSPLYWVRRIWVHHKFAKHVQGFYKHYWTFSEDQAREYIKEYKLQASTLYKCGNFPKNLPKKNPGNPIRLVYAGRLYCNRWKTLAMIGKALKEINKEKEYMILDVYTTEELTPKQKKALNPENSIYVRGRVTPTELIDIYHKADIALHVESMDIKNKLATRVSFSTKIIDLMSSTCAILAICWEEHTGYKYLKQQDAAFCISKYDDILPLLKQICNNPELIQEFAQKAYDCGVKNHSRKKIQNQMLQMFKSVIER